MIAGLIITLLTITIAGEETGVRMLLLSIAMPSAYILGAETGKNTEWELNWWKYIVLAFNVLTVALFTLGFVQGIIEM